MIRGRAYASAAAPRYAILPFPTKGAATSHTQVLTATFSPWILVLFQELDCCPQKAGRRHTDLFTKHLLIMLRRPASGPGNSSPFVSSPPFMRVVEKKGGGEDEEVVAFHGRHVPTRIQHACSGDACWMNACYRSLTCSIPALIVLELHLVQAEDAHEPSAHRSRLYHGAAQQDQHHWQRECDPAHSQDLLPC